MQVRAEEIGDVIHRVGDSLRDAEPDPELADFNYRDAPVRKVNYACRDETGDAQAARDEGVAFFDERVNRHHCAGGGKPPNQGKPDTDVTVEIERFLRVVPPFFVEKLLQNPARYKLKRGGKDNRRCEENEYIIPERIEEQHDARDAEAVYRTHRPVYEPAVRKIPVLHRVVHDFHAPPEERIDCDEEKNFQNIHTNIINRV